MDFFLSVMALPELYSKCCVKMYFNQTPPKIRFDFVTFQLVLYLLLVLVIFCNPKEVNCYQACIRFQYQKALKQSILELIYV